MLRAATHGNGVFERALLEEPTAISEDSQIVSQFRLEQNYPNPFNPVTTIQFTIGKSDFVSLKVFDLTGREVATLVNDEKLPGTYRLAWDAGSFASGVYFYRLQTSDLVDAKKLLLLK